MSKKQEANTQTDTFDNFSINKLILKGIHYANYAKPTDVQVQTLLNYQNYNDFIIASQTGSGKTLCFGIPIMSDIINQKEKEVNQEAYLRCLILSPTRELAMQINNHMERINKFSAKQIRICNLIGGLSKEKQQRLILSQPDILIATPGRLWELVSSGEMQYLSRLNFIDFLVLDEADKMIELGHFKELDSILGKIFNKQLKDKEVSKNIKKNKKQSQHQEIEQDGFESDDQDEEEEMENFYIKNSKTGAKVGLREHCEASLGINLKNEQIQEEEREEEDVLVNNIGEISQNDILNVDQIKKTKSQSQFINDLLYLSNSDKFSVLKKQFKGKRKVFLVSATLTQFFKGSKFQTHSKDLLDLHKKPDCQATMKIKVQALLEKVRFTSTCKPKIIDLTQQNVMPTTLTEYKTFCEESDKPINLYLYLQNNNIGGIKQLQLEENQIQNKNQLQNHNQLHVEKCLIFTNSISYARKLTSILQTLRLKVHCLHSEMPQKHRLKKLDQFRDGKICILVCTDVAARGLDIPNVDHVIHYQIPRDVDTYIHRSGRTARIGQPGNSYALVGPNNVDQYVQLCNAMKRTDIKNISNSTALQNCSKDIYDLLQKAVHLEKETHQVKKKKNQRKWFEQQSSKLGLELDDEIVKELNQEDQHMQTKKVKLQKEEHEYNQLYQQQEEHGFGKLLRDDKSRYSNKQKPQTKSRSQTFKRNSVFLDAQTLAMYAQQMNSEATKKRQIQQMSKDKQLEQIPNQNSPNILNGSNQQQIKRDKKHKRNQGQTRAQRRGEAQFSDGENEYDQAEPVKKWEIGCPSTVKNRKKNQLIKQKQNLKKQNKQNQSSKSVKKNISKMSDKK